MLRTQLLTQSSQLVNSEDLKGAQHTISQDNMTIESRDKPKGASALSLEMARNLANTIATRGCRRHTIRQTILSTERVNFISDKSVTISTLKILKRPRKRARRQNQLEGPWWCQPILTIFTNASNATTMTPQNTSFGGRNKRIFYQARRQNKTCIRRGTHLTTLSWMI